MVGRAGGIVAVLILLAALFVQTADVEAQDTPDAFTVNQALGRGVNLGNALEGPREGEWGLTLEAEFFELIAEAGFDHVRVPVRWSAYAGLTAPFEIPEGVDPTVPNADNIWQRVDWVIEQAEANGLMVMLNMHHYDEIFESPAAERDRFLAIWRQIATRYSSAGPAVIFELLNEPHMAFNDDPALWNTMFAEALSVVRESNPTRVVVTGPTQWNGIGALEDLVLPPDPNLIVSVHFYSPFPFTHQGAEWTDPQLPAPVSWEAAVYANNPLWQDWSWDSTRLGTTAGLEVTYDRQYAGLQFERGATFDADSLTLTSAGQAELQIWCRPQGEPETVVETITTTSAAGTYEIDLTACPSDVTGIVLLNAGTTAEPLVVTELEVCAAGLGCEAVIARNDQALASVLDRAAAWGVANERPMNVGEFGAYGAGGRADLAERAEWTSWIQTSALADGMSTTYWEFGAGFGIYDPDSDTWVAPLRDALVGDLERVPELGDVNCDGRANVIDALTIVQYEVEIRSATVCGLGVGPTEIDLGHGDVNDDASTNVVDALFIVQCEVGVPNDWCADLAPSL